MYDARYRYYSVRLSRVENWYKSQEELDIQTEKTTCNLPLHSSKMTTVISTQIEIAASPEEVRIIVSPLITSHRDPSLHPSQFSDLEH